MPLRVKICQIGGAEEAVSECLGPLVGTALAWAVFMFRHLSCWLVEPQF